MGVEGGCGGSERREKSLPEKKGGSFDVGVDVSSEEEFSSLAES